MSEEQVEQPTMEEIVDPYEAAEEEVEPVEEVVEEVVETPAETTETPKTTEAPVSETTETSSFEINLDERVYDPEIVEQFKQLKNHYDSVIAELNGKVLSMSNEAESTKTFSMFDELNDSDRFGVGKVKPNSTKGKNRQLVIDEMASLKAGYQATNRDVPSEDQLLKKAVNLSFGEQIAEKARAEVTEKVTARHNQRIARPNRRVSKPENSVAEATRNVAALMRDRGLGGASESFE